MKTVVGGRWSVVSWRVILVGCLLFAVCCLLSCGSVPNLESPECAASRDEIRRFYSFHFANEMKPSDEYLKLREPFITENLHFFISKQLRDEVDFFTLEKDYPKAFRVGKCEELTPDKNSFEVLLFWKDDKRSEQKPIKVETVKQNDKWLINRITVK